MFCVFLFSTPASHSPLFLFGHSALPPPRGGSASRVSPQSCQSNDSRAGKTCGTRVFCSRVVFSQKKSRKHVSGTCFLLHSRFQERWSKITCPTRVFCPRVSFSRKKSKKHVSNMCFLLHGWFSRKKKQNYVSRTCFFRWWHALLPALCRPRITEILKSQLDSHFTQSIAVASWLLRIWTQQRKRDSSCVAVCCSVLQCVAVCCSITLAVLSDPGTFFRVTMYYVICVQYVSNNMCTICE